jgi:hypothetical protein
MKIIQVEKQSILMQETRSGGHCEGLLRTLALERTYTHGPKLSLHLR